jgi:Uma2 family endonuclease
MGALPKVYYTPEQYLALERKAEYKSEYYNGEIFAMAGSSREHSIITCNVSGELRQQLKGSPCVAHSPDLRVQVSPTGLFTYPDVVVICGEPIFADSELDMVLNPTVIFEVLSDSTEAYDRGEKFAHYRYLETLAEYVLVSQNKLRVEQYVRQPNGDWLLHAVEGPDDAITLASLGCRLLLSEMYRNVSFDKPRAARRLTLE